MTQLHAGHRSRLKQRFASEGLASFQPHEALELLLFYAVPQRDVNPLAHALIDRFGSLDAVLHAAPGELAQVSGVGEHTAAWLTSLPAILDYYASLKLSDRPIFDRLSSVSSYCARLFSDADEEQFWTFNMNMAGHLLHSEKLSSGANYLRGVSVRSVVEPSLRYHAQTMVLVQNRAASEMRLTDKDVQFTSRLCDLLRDIRIQLMDNVLFCQGHIISMRECGVFRDSRSVCLAEDMAQDLTLHWLD